MFERVGILAEKLATNVSRRDFFSWASKGALALAGMMAFEEIARAGQQCPSVTVQLGTPCPVGYYYCPSGPDFIPSQCIPTNCKCCWCNGSGWAGYKGNCPRCG
jgi:hypothetical protein